MLRHKALLVSIAIERLQRGCRRVNPTPPWSDLTREMMRGAPGLGGALNRAPCRERLEREARFNLSQVRR
jgi:hypothetical protein